MFAWKLDIYRVSVYIPTEHLLFKQGNEKNGEENENNGEVRQTSP